MPVIAMKVIKAEAHPNADRLRLYQFDANDGAGLLQIVANLQNVYEVGDVVAIAQIGTLLPDGTEINKNKFRGERSFGMALGKTDKPVGSVVTEEFGCTDNEAKLARRAEAEANGVLEESVWTKYTSIDGYLKLRDDILAAPEIIVTEKSHGSNARFGFRGDDYLLGTHTSRILPDRMDASTWPSGHLLAHFLRWCVEEDIERRVMEWKAAHPEVYQMAVYGELMGFKCSDLHYGETEARYVKLFGEVQIDGTFLSYDDAVDVIKEMFPDKDVAEMLVPVLYRGLPDKTILRSLRDQPSTLAAANGVKQISEGIVIRANPEMYSEISHDRLIAKWKGPLYMERKSLKKLDPDELPVYLTANDLIFDFITAERIRHVWQKAQSMGLDLHMKHSHRIAEMLLDDIIKESVGEWPEGQGPETLDRKVLVRWTKNLAADLMAMVMQDIQVGMHE